MGTITLQWRELVSSARAGETEKRSADGTAVWMLWRDSTKAVFVSDPKLLADIDAARRLRKTYTPFLLIGPLHTGKNVFLNLVARSSKDSPGVPCVDENVGHNEDQEVKQFFRKRGVVDRNRSALLHFDFMENAVRWDKFIRKLHKLAIDHELEREDGQIVPCPGVTVVLGATHDLERDFPKEECLIKHLYPELSKNLLARTRRLSEQVKRLPTILGEMLATLVICGERHEPEVEKIEEMPLSVLDRLKKSPPQGEFTGLLGIVRAAARDGWEKAVEDIEREYGKRMAEREARHEADLKTATQQFRSEGFKQWAGGVKLATIAIVFTDIIDSTRLNREFGDKEWAKVRTAHFDEAKKQVESRQGFLIKTVGDEVMAAFHNAVDAVDFAVALEHNTGHPAAKIRAGVHVGQVEITDEDAFGTQVNMASRIAGKAENGGVWTSDRVKQDVFMYDQAAFAWEEHSGETLKGFDGETFTLWAVRKAGSAPHISAVEPQPLSAKRDVSAEAQQLLAQVVTTGGRFVDAESAGASELDSRKTARLQALFRELRTAGLVEYREDTEGEVSVHVWKVTDAGFSHHGAFLGQQPDRLEPTVHAPAVDQRLLQVLETEFLTAQRQLSEVLTWRDGKPTALAAGQAEVLAYLPSTLQRMTVTEDLRLLNSQGAMLRAGLEQLDRGTARGEIGPFERYIALTHAAAEVSKSLSMLSQMAGRKPATDLETDTEFLKMAMLSVELLDAQTGTAFNRELVQSAVVTLSDEQYSLWVHVDVTRETRLDPNWRTHIQLRDDGKFDDATTERIVLATCRYVLLRGMPDEMITRPDGITTPLKCEMPHAVIPHPPFSAHAGDPVWVRKTPLIASALRERRGARGAHG